MNTTDSMSFGCSYDHGSEFNGKIGGRLDQRFAKMTRGTAGADGGEIGTEMAPLTANGVALGARMLLVERGACRRIARYRVGDSLAAQLFHEGRHPPHVRLGQAERAGHFRIWDTAANHGEDLSFGVTAAEFAGVEHSSTSAFALLTMTMATASNVELAARLDVGRRGVRVLLCREHGDSDKRGEVLTHLVSPVRTRS